MQPRPAAQPSSGRTSLTHQVSPGVTKDVATVGEAIHRMRPSSATAIAMEASPIPPPAQTPPAGSQAHITARPAVEASGTLLKTEEKGKRLAYTTEAGH